MSAPPDPLVPVPAEPSDATTLAPMAAVAAEPAGRERRPGIGALGWVAAGWMIFVIALALLAPILPIDDPNAQGAGPRLPIGTEGHPLGTDSNQRDVLSRLIWGARSSLAVGMGAIAIGLLIGGTLGLVSGFRRGRIDTLLSSLFDILLAFPQLVLALSLVAFLSPATTSESTGSGGGLSNIQIVIIALGIVSIPLLARITRATTLSWAQREFVLAARAQGAKNMRIMLREVLPNVMPAMFSIALLGIAVAIIAEGGLSLLGVGVEPPDPSWGNMITENRNVRSAPLNVLFTPIIAVFFTVMALNYLGDVIRSSFDVRESAL